MSNLIICEFGFDELALLAPEPLLPDHPLIIFLKTWDPHAPIPAYEAWPIPPYGKVFLQVLKAYQKFLPILLTQGNCAIVTTYSDTRLINELLSMYVPAKQLKKIMIRNSLKDKSGLIKEIHDTARAHYKKDIKNILLMDSSLRVLGNFKKSIFSGVNKYTILFSIRSEHQALIAANLQKIFDEKMWLNSLPAFTSRQLPTPPKPSNDEVIYECSNCRQVYSDLGYSTESLCCRVMLIKRPKSSLVSPNSPTKNWTHRCTDCNQHFIYNAISCDTPNCRGEIVRMINPLPIPVSQPPLPMPQQSLSSISEVDFRIPYECAHCKNRPTPEEMPVRIMSGEINCSVGSCPGKLKFLPEHSCSSCDATSYYEITPPAHCWLCKKVFVVTASSLPICEFPPPPAQQQCKCCGSQVVMEQTLQGPQCPQCTALQDYFKEEPAKTLPDPPLVRPVALECCICRYVQILSTNQSPPPCPQCQQHNYRIISLDQ